LELGNQLEKKTILKIVLFLIFLPLTLWGQREYDTKIESQSRPGILWFVTWKPSNKPQPRKYDRFIFDIHYNDFQSPNDYSSSTPRSVGFTTNCYSEVSLNEKNTIAVGYGLGLSVNKTVLNQNMIQSPSNIINCFPKSSTDAYLRNSLMGTNINLPIELRFRTKGWKHTKFHLGGRLGYQLSLKEKYAFADVSRNHKISLKNAAEDFTYSFHARLGIRNYALYVSYQLNSIFQHPESPQIKWLQLGLSFSLF
jgi:hypothetical protein